MIKPKNTAEGLIVWENATPDTECVWHLGHERRPAWVQIVGEDATVELEGTLDPSHPSIGLEVLTPIRQMVSVAIPLYVRPRVVSGTATIFLQR